MKYIVDYGVLVQQKFLDFFADENAVYMFADGIHQPHYIGIAFEFVCELSSGTRQVDFDDLYNNVFKDKKWLYIDTLSEMSDEFIASLSNIQIVSIFAAMRHKELFCTGFIEGCGKQKVIIRLLRQLKKNLECK